MIRPPSAEELIDRWSEVAPLLKRATDRTQGCYEPIDILRQALQGIVVFWFIERDGRLEAVVVVEIRQTPRKRMLVVNFVAGRRLAEWWPEFVDTMDQLARVRGCSMITAYARPGWVRFWKARGVAVRVASEVMVREL